MRAAVAASLLLTLACAVLATDTLDGTTGSVKHCIQAFTTDLLASTDVLCPDGSNNDNNYAQLSSKVATFVSSCLHVQLNTSTRPVRIMLPNLGVPFQTAMQTRANAYLANSGYEVEFRYVPLYLVAHEALFDVNNNLTDSLASDGWYFDPSGTGTIASADGFADLSQFISADTQLQWPDITPFWRNVAGVYDNRVIGLPLDGDLMLMYYRPDILQRYNRTVPRTWEQYVDLAAELNGTDFDGDGVGDYGACIDYGNPICKGVFTYIAMLAPYIQSKGTSQGVFWDPATMTPMFNNSATEYTLRLWQRLFRYTPHTALTCDGSNSYFHSGRCLLTINWGDQFKASRTSKWSVAVAALPGSTMVLDRQDFKLKPCSKDLCPNAEAAIINGSEVLVNCAPFSAFGGWVGTVSKKAPLEYQQAAYDFFSYLASPNISWQDVMNPDLNPDPLRNSQIQDSAVPQYVIGGYNETLTRTYLSAIRTSLGNPNMVLDTRIMGGSRSIIDQATRNVTLQGNGNFTSVMDFMQQELLALLPKEPDARKDIQKVYWKVIGYVPPASAAAAGSGDPWQPAYIAAIVVPLSVIMLLALLVAVYLHSHSRHRSIFGTVLAPGVGPETTLLITDIQQSTLLWETLPAEVMDKALEVHHACLRQLLKPFCGYESATEGDSFILAFPTAKEALLYAVKAQADLLAAPWPQELLDEPPACVVLVSPGLLHAQCVALLQPVAEGVHDLDTCREVSGDQASFRRASWASNRWSMKRWISQDYPAPSSSGHALSLPLPTEERRPSLTDRTAQDTGAVVLTVESDEVSSALGRLWRVPSRPNQLVSSSSRDSPHSGATPFADLQSSLPARPLELLNGVSRSAVVPLAVAATGSLPVPEMILVEGDRHGSFVADARRSLSNEKSAAGVGQQQSQPQLAPTCTGGRLLSHTFGGMGKLPMGLRSVTLKGMLELGYEVDSSGKCDAHNLGSTGTEDGGTSGTTSEFLTLRRSEKPAVIFRGLRVRMGLHSGVTNPKDISHNPATSRRQYTGKPMAMLRAVGGSGAGGSIHLSEEAFARLAVAQIRHSAVVLYTGAYTLGDVGDVHLYQAVPPLLIGRLGLLPPPLAKAQLVAGVSSAPLGTIAVSFITVMGAGILLAWDVEEAQAALSLFNKIVRDAIAKMAGYLVKSADGVCVVAFEQPAHAVISGLVCCAEMTRASWSARLLEHELCETIAVTSMTTNGVAQRHVLLRGLRLKVGIDEGALKAVLSASTGRITYRGRTMNRAARVASTASAGQVLAPAAVWRQCRTHPMIVSSNVTAMSLGRMQLKGVPDPVELFECRMDGPLVLDGGASTHQSSTSGNN